MCLHANSDEVHKKSAFTKVNVVIPLSAKSEIDEETRVGFYL